MLYSTYLSKVGLPDIPNNGHLISSVIVLPCNQCHNLCYPFYSSFPVKKLQVQDSNPSAPGDHIYSESWTLTKSLLLKPPAACISSCACPYSIKWVKGNADSFHATGEATIGITNLITSIQSQPAVVVIKKESQLLNVEITG